MFDPHDPNSRVTLVVPGENGPQTYSEDPLGNVSWVDAKGDPQFFKDADNINKIADSGKNIEHVLRTGKEPKIPGVLGAVSSALGFLQGAPDLLSYDDDFFSDVSNLAQGSGTLLEFASGNAKMAGRVLGGVGGVFNIFQAGYDWADGKKEEALQDLGFAFGGIAVAAGSGPLGWSVLAGTAIWTLASGDEELNRPEIDPRLKDSISPGGR
jgi:hypothetical protein